MHRHFYNFLQKRFLKAPIKKAEANYMKIYRGVEHQKVLSIASNYNYSLLRLSQFNRKKVISKSESEIKEFYENYVERINKALIEFDPVEQCVLFREYFTPLPKNWWVNLYPRSTFYRIRLEATRKLIAILSV